MKLDIVVPTMRKEGWRENIDSWKTLATTDPLVIRVDNTEVNHGVIQSYQGGFERSTAEVVAFFHDDLIIHEHAWDERVLKEFEDPKVGVVGFGGALIHGSKDLYKTPYKLQQVGRSQYLSNMEDAEEHGQRFTGSCEVAVLDGFSLIIRCDLLHRLGGWPINRYPPHHCYDYWACCSAHSLGYTCRVLGITCHHQGGRTAVTDEYQEWAKKTPWGSDVNMHEAGHRMIYDDFIEVLPWSCVHPRNLPSTESA